MEKIMSEILAKLERIKRLDRVLKDFYRGWKLSFRGPNVVSLQADPYRTEYKLNEDITHAEDITLTEDITHGSCRRQLEDK